MTPISINYDISPTTSWSAYTQWTTANTTTYSLDGPDLSNQIYKTSNYDTDYYLVDTSTTATSGYYDYAVWKKCLRRAQKQIADGWYYYLDDLDSPARPASPADRLRQIIQARQAPLIIGSRKALQLPADPKEVRARETLFRVLGEEKYRGFMRNGFVSVRGKSGKVYQIFPGHGITQVYQHGTLVERLCVVLRGEFPPSDSLIMRFLLILNDEEEFRRLAVKHYVGTGGAKSVRTVDMRPLPEIFREMRPKVAAA